MVVLYESLPHSDLEEWGELSSEPVSPLSYSEKTSASEPSSMWDRTFRLQLWHKAIRPIGEDYDDNQNLANQVQMALAIRYPGLECLVRPCDIAAEIDPRTTVPISVSVLIMSLLF
ncbi:hypothetical protein RRF57_007728 [Xylaria bambusicola]|uniref:Uncharacterized protein n=1 Tax=Xylaria bambusicola TaxID=326684 RepID=A0AAN7V0Y0_9PEZI